MPDIERDILVSIRELGPLTTEALIRGWLVNPCDVLVTLNQLYQCGRIAFGRNGWVEVRE